MTNMVLKTENLGISFGGLQAVDKINMEIREGELYGLVGPNGAGKTTIFNLLTGVYQPTRGRFYLNGVDLTGKSQEKISAAGISRTFQNIRLFNNMSVVRNVMVSMGNLPEYACNPLATMFRLPYHYRREEAMHQKAKEILKIFDLYEERNNLSSNLPYGKQRKLEIARALANNPKLLLLDEPAAGMNPNETEDLMNIVRRLRDEFHVTVLLIDHDMHFVSGLCDRMMVLNFGQTLAEGTPEEVLNNEKVIHAYIGK